MSNIYIQEPPTNGKVLLKTSCGELDIELWSKEAPKACRNFVQLCMEGYYDGTIFHRIIRNFMAQGGDPTGTGEGGESIYGHPFRDEFHSRLRFARRGLVAMANAGPHDNGSQFFITLGPCEHLQGKHTIFGKIAGNTIYNAVKLGEVDIGADDRPVYPPKIKATQVLANPFDDIIPRQLKKRHEKEEKKSKSKSKATKNFSLLSFGEEAEEDEEETVVASQSMKNKSKSMHDLVKDPNLSSVPAVEIEKEEKSSPEERLHPKQPESDDEDDDDEEEEEEREEHERRRWDKKKEANDKKKEMTDKIRSKLTKEKKKPEEMAKEPPKEEKPLSRKEELQEESRKLKEELRDSRKRKQKQESNQEQAEIKSDEAKKDEMSGKGDELDEFHAQKKKFKTMRKSMAKKGSSREEQTLALLAKFQNKLHSAILNKKPEPEKEEEEEEEEEKEEGEYREGEEEMKEDGEEEEGDDWLVHSLQFDSHENKVKDANVKDSDTFTIFDPRNPMNQRRREDGKQKKKDRR